MSKTIPRGLYGEDHDGLGDPDRPGVEERHRFGPEGDPLRQPPIQGPVGQRLLATTRRALRGDQ